MGCFDASLFLIDVIYVLNFTYSGIRINSLASFCSNSPVWTKTKKSIRIKVLVEKWDFGEHRPLFDFDPNLKKCSGKYWKSSTIACLDHSPERFSPFPFFPWNNYRWSLWQRTNGHPWLQRFMEVAKLAPSFFKDPLLSSGDGTTRHFCLRSPANLWARLLIEKDPAKQLIPNILGSPEVFFGIFQLFHV